MTDSVARTLTCGVCKVCQFDTTKELENHEKSCDGLYKEIFTCDVCKVADFDTLEEAIEHENRCRDQNNAERMRMEQSTRQQFQLDQPSTQQEKIFVTIPPGRIGLTLKLNKLLGGATVTKVEENSTTGGKVHVDDRIISIDNHQIARISDYAINWGQTRTLEVSKARQPVLPKFLKHALFSSSSNTNSNSASDPLPSAVDTSTIFTPSNIANNAPALRSHNSRDEKEVLSVNLRPVEIPFDPIDENFDYSLERELAWLIEESAIILPELTQTSGSQPFILDFAWRHCSFELRSAIGKAFPTETRNVVKSMKVDMTDQEIREKYYRENSVTVVNADLLDLVDKDKIRHLRGDVQRVVFNLGFRRSSSIERELNVFLSERVVDAVGEVATNKPPRRQRIRRKRLLNDDLILTADEVNQSVRTTAKTLDEIVSIARNVPSELSVLEDEVVFLIEESLLLLPDHMLVGSSDNIPQKIITSVVSAGLTTTYNDDINWNYVYENASQQLKQVLEKKGIKRRPLQRIIRYHEAEVRVAFERRRVEICKLLILDGYRREQTRAYLPSNDLLKQVGLLNVMKVRLKYRLRSCESSEQATKKDLRAARNTRKKKQRIHPKKKLIALDFTKVDPKRHSVLTDNEKELCFLREEFEVEYEHSCFDWDYIEKRSSRQLRQIMSEKEVTPLRANPSIAGVSKLKKLVRLDSVEIFRAFTDLRQDIRYALHMGFKRNLQSNHLPNLPPAPVRRCASRGTNVVDVESSCGGAPSFDGIDVSWQTNLLCGEWKLGRELHSGATIHQQPLLPSAIAAVFELMGEKKGVHDCGDGSSHQTEIERSTNY